MLWRSDAFNAWGRIEQQTYGNAVTGRTSFEAYAGRTLAVTAGTSGSTSIVNYAYSWNSLGQLTQRTDANGDGTSGAITDSFVYDDIGRLTNDAVSSTPTCNPQRLGISSVQRARRAAVQERRRYLYLRNPGCHICAAAWTARGSGDDNNQLRLRP